MTGASEEPGCHRTQRFCSWRAAKRYSVTMTRIKGLVTFFTRFLLRARMELAEEVP